MVKARKLKSGAWNVRVLDYTDDNGKAHYTSITAPTSAEAEFLASKYIASRPAPKKRQRAEMTVRKAIEKYIADSMTLSPTTVHGYKKMLEHGFQDLMDKTVKSLDDDIMQQAINAECRRPSEKAPSRPISAKTVLNEWGLLSSALRAVCGRSFDVKLPKKQQHVKDLPEPQAVLDAIVGSSIELPCLLAMWLSFSMSEIRGLMCSSIRNGYVIIDQVMVDAEEGSIIKRDAKTASRLRMHRLPPYILELIENTETYKTYAQTGRDGLLVPLNPNQLDGRWRRICRANGFKMNFHDLRHMSASVMLSLGVPDKYAMERGGWSTPAVMKSVYQHTFSSSRIAVDNKIDAYFEDLLGANLARKSGTEQQKP